MPQTYTRTRNRRSVHVNGCREREGRFDLERLTPMYDRLETNIPRDLMGFSDLNWPQDCQLFPERKKVLQYIQRYAEDVHHLIQFQTTVLDVRLTVDERWIVTYQKDGQIGKGKVEEQIFDAVLVASGHFDVHYMPAVRGIEAWSKVYPGAISHSKFYRRPESFAGKKVIVVGNSASGSDIGAQIQTTCKWPLLMSQKSESFLLNDQSPSKVDRPPIAEYIVEGRSVRFEDGTVETGIDSVLYCTGYLYSFPFLESLNPPVVTNGERVENTYQHIFYRPQPTLAFSVLNQKIVPFPLAESQGAVIARVWAGRLSLPGAEAMQEWEEGIIAEQGDGKGFHVLNFPSDANYINMCFDWAMSADGESLASRGLLNGASKPHGVKLCKRALRWGEREYWIRGRLPAVKKAFQDCGEARHVMRTLENVGFSFEQWKKENLSEYVHR